jgi:hypothetical protein
VHDRGSSPSGRKPFSEGPDCGTDHDHDRATDHHHDAATDHDDDPLVPPLPLPTTPTTVPSAPVPDAATAGHLAGNSQAAIDVLRQAGFSYFLADVDWASCYLLAMPGQAPEWNGGAVVGQIPSPGTVEPLGSTVIIQVCGPPPQTYYPPSFFRPYPSRPLRAIFANL